MKYMNKTNIGLAVTIMLLVFINILLLKIKSDMVEIKSFFQDADIVVEYYDDEPICREI